MASKYQPIYDLLAREGYEQEGTITWQRNRWYIKFWKGGRLHKIAMKWTSKEFQKFYETIETLIK